MIYIGVFVSIASIYLFTQYNKVRAARRDERREEIRERRQELLDKALKAKKRSN